MKKSFENKISALLQLSEFFSGEAFDEVIQQAQQANPWFTPEMVRKASEAIASTMLCERELRAWLENYQPSVDFSPKTLAIVTAGNIPLVGFYDLLCGFLSGHKVILKPSSRDFPLMSYVAENLSRISGEVIQVCNSLEGEQFDILVAMSSDTTAQTLKETYPSAYHILRGSRHSLAVLRGNETQEELIALREDMFLYWGMGCRNITHLLLPVGYDLSRITSVIKSYSSPSWLEKVTYERARLTMLAKTFTWGDSYILREIPLSEAPPLGVVGYSYYDGEPQLDTAHLQCTVGYPPFEGDVTLGQSQYPTLGDFPNGVDLLRELLEGGKL